MGMTEPMTEALGKRGWGNANFPKQERHVGTPRTFSGVYSADTNTVTLQIARQTSTEQ